MLFKDHIQSTWLQSRRTSMRSRTLYIIFTALIFQNIRANKILDEERLAMQVELTAENYKFWVILVVD